MTAILSAGIVLLFFLIPYLTGNAYGFVFRKKTMGIVSTYLSGVAIVYALLTAIQLLVVKFKFDFSKTINVYNVLFIVCVVLGGVGFLLRLCKDKAVKWDVLLSRKSIWVFGLIVCQGILYIVLKNPYFENNALLETTGTVMETGTIYEYNAFTGKEALAGFPLSNKLIFLPVFYAYISTLFGVEPAVLFNFVFPVVTFLNFYLVMLLWVQKLGEEHKVKWEMLLLLLLWIVQVGDGWSHSTAFRIFHSGYTGEAIFFGVLLAYSLYALKNKCYLIALTSIFTFPGLVKYDTVFEFLRNMNEYRKDGAMYGGMLLVYILAAIFYIVQNKKFSAHLLNLNLTICFSAAKIWERFVALKQGKGEKLINKAVILILLLMCGNVMVISNTTEWRSNIYGASKAEYELLEKLDAENEDDAIKVVACDELARWIKRLDLDMEPVIGYDLGGKGVWWYSYEEYDENHTRLWQNVNYATAYMEQELLLLADEIEMDYVLVKRITDRVPISGSEEVKCVYETPSYLVYSVDKK